MAKRLRRRWIVLLALVGLGLAGFFGLRSLLQPERISAFLLQQIETATGLEVTLQQPADIGWWPDLHVELTGVEIRMPGAVQAILRVAQVDVTLPWAALRSGEDIHLRGLRLLRPDLDVAALLELIDNAADDGPPAPLQLPTLDAPLQVRDGRIAGDRWTIEQLVLNLPALHDGVATQLDAQGALALESTRHLFALQLATTPAVDGDTLQLSPLVLDLVLDRLPSWHPHLDGNLRWQRSGPLNFDLHSQIATWPADWPELPLPPPDAPTPTELVLRYDGDASLHGTAVFAVMRGEDGARGSLTLNDAIDWLGGDHASPLPPLDASIEIPRLHYDGIDASGVRLRMQASDKADD